MPTKLATATAVALAVIHPASAETRVSVRAPSASAALPITIVQPGGEGRVNAAKLVRGDGGIATFSFDVMSTAAGNGEVIVPIHVAPRTRVVGLAATVGGRRMITESKRAMFAAARYEVVVGSARDPALLEHVATTDSGDELRLRVFPLSKKQGAHIELTIELPVDERIAWMTADPVERVAVSPRVSLLALEPPFQVPVVIGCGLGVAHMHGDLDKAIIRRYVNRQLPRVIACYSRELLRNKKLAGRVDLHFTISPDGHTRDIEVDGELASDTVKSCIADDLGGWEFPAVPNGGGIIRVNYPLTFVPPT